MPIKQGFLFRRSFVRVLRPGMAFLWVFLFPFAAAWGSVPTLNTSQRGSYKIFSFSKTVNGITSNVPVTGQVAAFTLLLGQRGFDSGAPTPLTKILKLAGAPGTIQLRIYNATPYYAWGYTYDFSGKNALAHPVGQILGQIDTIGSNAGMVTITGSFLSTTTSKNHQMTTITESISVMLVHH
jgi:hypothetical protein